MAGWDRWSLYRATNDNRARRRGFSQHYHSIVGSIADSHGTNMVFHTRLPGPKTQVASSDSSPPRLRAHSSVASCLRHGGLACDRGFRHRHCPCCQCLSLDGGGVLDSLVVFDIANVMGCLKSASYFPVDSAARRAACSVQRALGDLIVFAILSSGENIPGWLSPCGSARWQKSVLERDNCIMIR